MESSPTRLPGRRLPIRVLLVDDSQQFIVVAADFLSRDATIQIVGSATSGQDALEKVAVLHPDVVLMDFSMPRMNGLQAMRRVKAGPAAPRVIIVTINDDSQYRAAAAAAGADGFVGKSDFRAIGQLIRQLFPPRAAGTTPEAMP